MYPGYCLQLTMSQLKVYKEEIKYKPVGFTVAKRRALLRSVITLLNYSQIELAACFRANDNGQLDRIVDILLDHMEHMFQTQTAKENPYKWVGADKIMPRSYKPEYIDGKLCTINTHWKKLSRAYADFGSSTIRLNISYGRQFSSGTFLLHSLIHEICHAFVFWHHPEEHDLFDQYLLLDERKFDRINRQHKGHLCRIFDCRHNISHWIWWRRVTNACLHIFGLKIVSRGDSLTDKWAIAFVEQMNKPFRLSSAFCSKMPRSSTLSKVYLYHVEQGQLYTIKIDQQPAFIFTIKQLKEYMMVQHGIDSLIMFLGIFADSILLNDPNTLGHYGIMDEHKINFYTYSRYLSVYNTFADYIIYAQ